VEETLARDASVAGVARAHGVNTNQVVAWRRQYQQGLLKAAKRLTPGLLAVRLAEGGVQPRQTPSPRARSGMIQVELPRGKLRLTGQVDPQVLRVVLEALRG
jgi:transposase